MAMYHSWDSQNAWLRQIHTHNYLFVNPKTAGREGITDGGWMWVESQWGKVRCMCRLFRSGGARHGLDLERHRQIRKGAWNLTPDANESQEGLFAQPPDLGRTAGVGCGAHISNSDPITGQAAWYDVRVRIYKAEAGEPAETFPQFKAVPAAPGVQASLPRWQAWFAGKGMQK
jgi:anaerobic selenocysteine-containing dehydrogenase